MEKGLRTTSAHGDGGSCFFLHYFQGTLHGALRRFDYHDVIGEWLMNRTLSSPSETVNIIMGKKL